MQLFQQEKENLIKCMLRRVNEMLAQMTNCGEKGIFVIGATKSP
jgi:hypothetical protein